MAFLWGTSVSVKDQLHTVCFAEPCMGNTTQKKSANNQIPEPQTPEFLFIIQTSSTTDN